MKVSVVIPVGPNRVENLIEVLRTLEAQTAKDAINEVVLVCDGNDAGVEMEGEFDLPLAVITTAKHEPGREQPRNVGVRVVEELNQDREEPSTHVWFLDSDVIVLEDCLVHYLAALETEPNRVLIGPYDWLPPGIRIPIDRLRNDPAGVPPPGRWGSFDQYDPEQTLREDLSAGLACFSGNLIWPIDEFLRVGGFWNELHHGRCEDGELGLRAVAMGVGIGFVRSARGWHLDHGRNVQWILNTNAIDVPKINERHPWVEGEGMFVVEEDGKRFDVRCACGWAGNTALIWSHQANDCPNSPRIEVVQR